MRTTFAADDAWINRRIRRGILSPGARGMTATDAAEQYNAANTLDPSDADYLHAPEQAQRLAHDVLRLVDVQVADHHDIVLTDYAAGPRAGGTVAVTCGQIAAAVEQFRLVTGDTLSVDALIDALPWD